MLTYAIVRRPGPNCVQGITTAGLGLPSYELLARQHESYVEALASLGLQVILLEAEPDYPDAYFVEDVAVVTPDVAVIANPGADARKGEVEPIVPILARYRKTVRIEPPGTLDGGDVLMVDRHFYIGVSERTNEAGAQQLGQILDACGYAWTRVQVGAGLHLKSGVNHVGSNTLLLAATFAEHNAFEAYDKIVITDEESYAANTLWVNGTLLVPKGFPDARRQLEGLGLPILELDVSEVRKMDGGLTCLSLRF